MICQFIKEGGETCNANAMSESKFCFFHNPDITDEEKRLAQSKGGKANKIIVLEELQPIEIKDLGDVFNLISDAINRVRAGKLDTKIANTIFYGSGQLIRAYELKELENRVAQLERAVELK